MLEGNLDGLNIGDGLEGNLGGLVWEAAGPAREKAESQLIQGPRQACTNPPFPLERDMVPVCAKSPSALICDLDNMEALQFKDDEEATRHELGENGAIALGRKGAAIPCSKITKQVSGNGNLLSPTSLKHWKRRARAQGQKLSADSPEQNIRKRKGGTPLLGNKDPATITPCSPLVEAALFKKVRTQAQELDCEMIDDGMVEAGFQPHRSL